MNIFRYLFSSNNRCRASRPMKPAVAIGRGSTGGRRWLAAALLWLLIPPGVQAQAVIETLEISPDVTMVMPFTGSVIVIQRGTEWFSVDPATGLSTTGLSGSGGLFAIPIANRGNIGLDAYDRSLNAFSIDIDAMVNTGSGPFFMRAGEIYSRGGTGSSTKLFDPVAAGLPANTNVDAISVDPASGNLVFSVANTSGSPVVLPSDLYRWDGSNLSLFFDGLRVPRELNLDAAHVLSDGRILMSFDTAGSIDGIGFRDEELMLYDPVADTFALHTITAGFAADWFPADLDALSVVERLELLVDGFEDLP